MQPPIELETERLVLNPLGTAETDDLHRLWSHPEVARYLWDGIELPRAQTAEVVAESQLAFAEGRYGLWAARRRRDPRLVGVAGFWPFHLAEPELIYALDVDFWGRGYAVEMARAALFDGLERYDLDTAFASTDPPNRASVRVMERLGMSFWKQVDREAQPTVYYRLERPIRQSGD